MMRYIRAFWTALRMTLRGEQPPDNPYVSLSQWMERSVVLVDAVMKAANSRHLGATALKTIKVRVDGRDTNAEIVLATVKHHMTIEYPYMLHHSTRNNVNAIHASNLNDVYRISCLIDLSTLQDATMKQSLTALKAHLEMIPPQISQ